MKRIGLAFAAVLLISGAGCKKKEAPSPAPPPAVSDAATTAEVPATPDAAVLGESVAFTGVPPAVGDVREVTDTNKLTGTVKTLAGDTPLAQHRMEKRTEEVLAVDGAVITKLKVTYAALITETPAEGKKKPVDRFAGKSFVLSWEKGALVIRDAGGKPVPDDMVDDIRAGVADVVGRENPMNAILSGRPLRVGERIVLSPEQAKLLAREGGPAPGTETALTLLERKDDVATVQLENTVQNVKGPMTVQVAMKGTAKLQISTMRPLELNLAGDIKGTGAGELSGTMSGTKIFVYRGGKP